MGLVTTITEGGLGTLFACGMLYSTDNHAGNALNGRLKARLTLVGRAYRGGDPEVRGAMPRKPPVVECQMTSKNPKHKAGKSTSDVQPQQDDAEASGMPIARAHDDINPARHAKEIGGPLGKDAVHRTESKVDHSQGKSRHGIGQRRGHTP